MKLFSIFLFTFFVLCLEAETFNLKLPIPCTVDIESKNGFWEIKSQFNAARSFPADLSKKIDRKHAEHICYAALKKIYKIKTGNITFSGLQTVSPPKYDQKKVSFSFKIPQASIKIVKYQTDNSKKSKTAAFYPEGKTQKTTYQ